MTECRCSGVKPRVASSAFEVLVVLPQRLQGFERTLMKLLRALRLLFAAEDPAAHLLCFLREDAVGREEYVVDLRRAVWRVQGGVV